MTTCTRHTEQAGEVHTRPEGREAGPEPRCRTHRMGDAEHAGHTRCERSCHGGRCQKDALTGKRGQRCKGGWLGYIHYENYPASAPLFLPSPRASPVLRGLAAQPAFAKWSYNDLRSCLPLRARAFVAAPRTWLAADDRASPAPACSCSCWACPPPAACPRALAARAIRWNRGGGGPRRPRPHPGPRLRAAQAAMRMDARRTPAPGGAAARRPFGAVHEQRPRHGVAPRQDLSSAGRHSH